MAKVVQESGIRSIPIRAAQCILVDDWQELGLVPNPALALGGVRLSARWAPLWVTCAGRRASGGWPVARTKLHSTILLRLDCQSCSRGHTPALQSFGTAEVT
jgi:hypothetical protein